MQVAYKPYTHPRYKTVPEFRYLLQLTFYLCLDTYTQGTFLVAPWRKYCSRLGRLPVKHIPHSLLPEKNSRADTKETTDYHRQFVQPDPSNLLSWRTDGCMDILCDVCAVKPLQLGKSH